MGTVRGLTVAVDGEEAMGDTSGTLRLPKGKDGRWDQKKPNVPSCFVLLVAAKRHSKTTPRP